MYSFWVCWVQNTSEHSKGLNTDAVFNFFCLLVKELLEVTNRKFTLTVLQLFIADFYEIF